MAHSQKLRNLLATGILLALCSGCGGYHGLNSDHFDGTRFSIQGADHSFSAMLRWLWEMETVPWPEWITDPKQPPPQAEEDGGKLRVTYINHATVLIQLDKMNILTDPIWSDRAGPYSWLGVKRVRSPGVLFENLPHIDLILLSHDHYDHLDLPSLRMIAKRDNPKVIAGLGLKSLLNGHGLAMVEELDWWQEYPLPGKNIAITFVPALHNSGRLPFMENRTLWGGYVLTHPDGNIYFAGDTGLGDFIYQIAKKFQPIRLTILPIGNYEKRWFMKNQHMNPDDSLRVHEILRARQSMGMHFGTFAEHPEQAIDAHERDLAAALVDHALAPSAFWILGFGESRYVPEIKRDIVTMPK
ncbi:MAG: MBL fold metallo-hydrolase [Desulfoprunum sp.]|nr:MBL fold metallo-hydrolase [Desulfoprunum sp.]